MKKVKFEGKLKLNKETVAKLDNNQMNNVKGGAQAASFITLCRSCINTNSPICGTCVRCIPN